MQLQNPALGVFLRATTDSFDADDLTQILLERFGLRYDHVTNDRLAWKMQVINVHHYFDMRNRTEQLVAALRDARPNVPELSLVADGLGFSTISGASGLEVLVQRPDAPYQDVGAFRASLSMIEAAVCQVLVGSGAGTGTLIADDIVITNHHVVASLIDSAGALTGPVTCRFDYKTNGGYTTPEIDVAATRLLAKSPHAVEDVRVGPMATNPAALDYALLKLDRAFGREPVVANGAERGHVDVSAPPGAADNDGVLVLQHPGGKPMKIDIGSVTGVGDVRFRHSVNTERGSSGAPVFDGALRMIGIHHAGHENGLGSPLTYNEAIPLGPILADARAQQVAI